MKELHRHIALFLLPHGNCKEVNHHQVDNHRQRGGVSNYCDPFTTLIMATFIRWILEHCRPYHYDIRGEEHDDVVYRYQKAILLEDEHSYFNGTA